MEPIRSALEEIMQIHVFNNLLNPDSFPIRCFNLKKIDDENGETNFFEFFFSGVLHSLAEIFDSQLY